MGGPHVLRQLVPRLSPRPEPGLLADLGEGVLVGRIPPEEAEGWSYRTVTGVPSLPPQPDGTGLRGDMLVFGLSKAAGARAQRDVITIGRARSNDVVLGHTMVSKLHARFRPGPPTTLEDAASSNGVIIEAVTLAPEQPHPLGDGQMISFGGVVLTFFARDTFVRLVTARAAKLT